MEHTNLSASEALERLRRGNEAYLTAHANPGDISPELREKTCREGQQPYAIVVACSDSRVMPESIFSAGLGELFVIRVAGNVMDAHQLGSVAYAAEHLGCRLAVVLGHTCCGAVHAAIFDEPEGYVKTITDEIRRAIGGEREETAACRRNIDRSAGRIRAMGLNGLTVARALYHTATGRVEFLD